MQTIAVATDGSEALDEISVEPARERRTALGCEQLHKQATTWGSSVIQNPPWP